MKKKIDLPSVHQFHSLFFHLFVGSLYFLLFIAERDTHTHGCNFQVKFFLFPLSIFLPVKKMRGAKEEEEEAEK